MERRLAAILAADVVGYSRLIRANEDGTLATFKSLRADLIDPRIDDHNGRIVKLMGDGMLVEFTSVVDAVCAASEMQQALAKHNAGLTTDSREKPSVFVRESVKNAEYGAIELGEPNIAEHRCGSCGGRMLGQTSKKGVVYFSCEHKVLCGEMLRPCSACGRDLPVINNVNPDQFVCNCGAEFPACPECSDGWLVERKGRYGKFLGCVKYPECKGSRQIS